MNMRVPSVGSDDPFSTQPLKGQTTKSALFSLFILYRRF